VKKVIAPSAIPGVTRLPLPFADTSTRHTRAAAAAKIERSEKARTVFVLLQSFEGSPDTQPLVVEQLDEEVPKIVSFVQLFQRPSVVVEDPIPGVDSENFCQFGAPVPIRKNNKHVNMRKAAAWFNTFPSTIVVSACCAI